MTSYVSEPGVFRISRYAIFGLLGLLYMAAIAANAVIYIYAPIVLRQTTQDLPITFPNLLINAYNFSRGDVPSLQCIRTNRDVNSPVGMDQESLALQANVTTNVDYLLENYISPPFQNSTGYLVDFGNAASALWTPFSTSTPNYDLYISCGLNITNTNNVTLFLLGEVLIEPELWLNGTKNGGTTTNIPPTFSATNNLFLLANEQYFNIIVTVSENCDLSGNCAFSRDITVTQASTLPPMVAPAGAASFGRNIVTIQISNSPGSLPGTFQVEVYEAQRSYTYTEVISSLASMFSLLLWVYTVLMGDRRVTPLGMVQRWLFAKRSSDYVLAVEREAGSEVQGLRDLLFRMFLQGYYVREKGGRGVLTAAGEERMMEAEKGPLPEGKMV